MRRLVQIDRRTGKKYVINIPSWDDYIIPPIAQGVEISGGGEGDSYSGPVDEEGNPCWLVGTTVIGDDFWQICGP